MYESNRNGLSVGRYKIFYYVLYVRIVIGVDMLQKI